MVNEKVKNVKSCVMKICTGIKQKHIVGVIIKIDIIKLVSIGDVHGKNLTQMMKLELVRIPKSLPQRKYTAFVVELNKRSVRVANYFGKVIHVYLLQNGNYLKVFYLL